MHTKNDVFDSVDHLDPSSRLSIMEKKYKVVEDHSITVSKLSTKVSLLLTIMSFAVIIVTGGAVYTFTGLDQFKDVYNEDRLEIHHLVLESQIENREMVRNSMQRLENVMDDRYDVIEKGMDDRIKRLEESLDKRLSALENEYPSLKNKKVKID